MSDLQQVLLRRWLWTYCRSLHAGIDDLKDGERLVTQMRVLKREENIPEETCIVQQVPDQGALEGSNVIEAL